MNATLRGTVCLIAALCYASVSMAATTQRIVTLPEGTRIYLELLERVSGKRGEASEGDMVKARVWRDVSVGGVALIKAGTIAQVRVDKVKHAQMFGMKGKLSLGAVETKTVDDQVVDLTGGYHKEGKSYAAATTTVALILFWPAMFVFGKAAELPAGTVFDAFTVNTIRVALAGEAAAPSISLASLSDKTFSAEFMMDNLQGKEAPKNFQLRVTGPIDLPETLVIDNVNGAPVEPLPLTISNRQNTGDAVSEVAEVPVKTLVKLFRKGINRVEVAYTLDGERHSAEAILNAQI